MKKDVYGLIEPQGANMLAGKYFLNRFISVSDFSSTEVSNQKIFKVEKKEDYPLSYNQKRIYYANEKLDDKNTDYNITFGILFKNKIAPSKIQNILDKLIQTHSVFRTVFKYENGVPVQSILEDQEITIDIERSSLDVQELVDSFSSHFDLEKNAPIINAKIVFLENDSSLLLINTHKIALDEISLDIFLRDFFMLYNGKEIDKNDINYIDYTAWEDKFLKSDKVEIYENFWLSKFRNKDLTTLNLPYDNPVDTTKSLKREETSIELSKDYFENIENIAKENNISSYSVFLACVYVLLYRYTFKSDIIVGVPFVGRNFKEIQNIIGSFETAIPLIEKINANIDFISFAKNINQDIIEAVSNQPYPYEVLEDKLGLKSDNSLFDIMFTYQKLEPREYDIGEAGIKIFTKDTVASKSNLEFKIAPQQNTLNLEFNKNIFKLSTAKSMLAHYLYILKQVCKDPKYKISEFSMITPEESRLLEKFETPSDIINDNTVLSIFGADKKKIEVHILDKDMSHVPIGSFRQYIRFR